MKRRDLLKFGVSIPAVVVSTSTESWGGVLGNPPHGVPLKWLLKRPQIHWDGYPEIHVLCRRPFDGEIELDAKFMEQFVNDSWSHAYTKLSEFSEDISDLEFRYGRRAKEWDVERGRIAFPPYYVWCRWSCWVGKDQEVEASLRRSVNGLLKPKWI